MPTPTIAMPNGFEERARFQKALKLAHVLREAGATSADVQTVLTDDTVWDAVARQANVKMPSAETRTMVLGILAAGEGLREAQHVQ